MKATLKTIFYCSFVFVLDLGFSACDKDKHSLSRQYGTDEGRAKNCCVEFVKQ